MMMRDLLSIERIIPRLSARSKLDALRALAKQAAANADAPPATVRSAITEYAQLPAFGPGAGASLVHAFVPGLRSPVAMFAKLDPAIDFGAADGLPTDLLMLLLSPTKSTSDHLRALACIARTLRAEDMRGLLRASTDRETLYVVLCGGEHEALCEPHHLASRV
jgi:PTS system nitrogen regulatory IIA component